MDVVNYGCLDLILEEELAMQVQISLKFEDTFTHKEIIITSQKHTRYLVLTRFSLLSCFLNPTCVFWVSLSGVDGYVASVAGDKFVLQSGRELWRMLSCHRLSAHVKNFVLQHLKGPGEHRKLVVNCNWGRIQGVQRIWEFGHQEGEKRKRMMLVS